MPARQKALIAAASWALAFVAAWQLVWLPTQARLYQAEQGLERERELAAYLQRVSRVPATTPALPAALSLARLNERAQAAGLQVTGLETKGQQVEMSLEGPPGPLLAWLQALELDGGRIRTMQLQVVGEHLQARVGLAPEGA